MNTMQEEFDAVVLHLYTQKRPASKSNVDGPGCYYRMPQPDGPSLSCAVGCRIPDATYVPDMDIAMDNGGTSVDNLILRFGPQLPPEIKEYEGLFTDLQGVHDGATTLSGGEFCPDWLASKLQSVATRFQLTFTVPQGV